MMRTAATLLFATGTLLVAGCSLLIDAKLEEKATTSGGGGGAGGAGGADTASVASTSAGMMMPVTAAQSVSASASSGVGCGPDCKLDHAKSMCVNDVCVIKNCDSHFDDCDNKPENGCETSLETDGLHCGTCAKACTPPMNHCMDSKCK